MAQDLKVKPSHNRSVYVNATTTNRKRKHEAVEKSSERPSNDHFSGKCFNCDQSGHRRKNCPKFNQKKAGSTKEPEAKRKQALEPSELMEVLTTLTKKIDQLKDRHLSRTVNTSTAESKRSRSRDRSIGEKVSYGRGRSPERRRYDSRMYERDRESQNSHINIARSLSRDMRSPGRERRYDRSESRRDRSRSR